VRLGRSGIRAGLLAVCLAFGCESRPSHTYIENFDPRELDAYGAGFDEAVLVGGEAVPPPRGGPLRPDEEIPMRGGPGQGAGREAPGRRSPSFRPDRITDLEGRLKYFEVFTPAITPFKRVSALDAVVVSDDVPVLGVSQSGRTRVPIEGLSANPPDGRERDRFWGSVVLDFGEGTVVPLPTVSPESRILALTSDPAVGLAVEKDGADNFFVVGPPKLGSEVRVTYVLDAPRSYFGAALPDTPSDALAAQVPRLPERAAHDGLKFARELGLTRGMPVSDALRALANHFRSFEESREPPRDSGNIFLDLARHKRGVCRHRAYAFVITAQALGIPSRFVQNEAHAWVEVKVPELGFLRLDLGGAAEGLEPHATDDRPSYRPRVTDPWPRPLAYEESYSRAAELSGQRGRGTGGPSEPQPGGETRMPGDMTLKPTLAMGQGESREALIDDDREPLALRITRYVPEVMRGSMLEVDGVAQALAGGAVEGLRVEVSLAEPVGNRAVLLGVSVTDANGRFRGAFAIPPDLDPSDYALVVVTPGDAKYAAARAE
jgi:transglutaminase-like putative cysteine protease